MNNEQFKNWRKRQATSQSSLTESPLVMGILNVTPDSFSDGGCYSHIENALKRAEKLLIDGADIIDIGGESSRPGAKPVSAEEELARVIPLIERITRECDVCISIDTTKASVMLAAVNAGAGLINDISALSGDESLATVSQLQVPVCLMHMQGKPATMQNKPLYHHDVITEINDFFQTKINRCLKGGVIRENLILDPGFGFGKTVQHNLKIVKHLGQFKQHQLPIMLGVSRKSTLGAVINAPVNERLIAGITVNAFASVQGVALIRTHDVKETKQALMMIKAIMQTE